MNKTKIDYVDMTWNPVTGCLHNCDYCYAERLAKRFGREYKSLKNYKGIHVLEKPFESYTSCMDISVGPYPYEFQPTFHKYRLDEPTKLKKPSKIFVCSMADLFGEWVPDSWICEIMNECCYADQHKYLFLTKNPKRYRALRNIRCTDPCCWYGTTATNQAEANKNIIEFVHTLGNKFLSLEPLMGLINLKNIDHPEAIYNCLTGTVHTLMGYTDDRPKVKWVIIGAMTGPGAIKPKTEWIQSIVEQCKTASVPVFMKNNLAPYWQGELIQEWPEELK